MKACLISTVGVSLYKWLSQKSLLNNNLKPEEIACYLLEYTDGARSSAEISSINSIINEGFLDQTKDLFLLLSDTEEGILIGKILGEYYKNVFIYVHLVQIEGLNSDNEVQFKENGLKNLVKAISGIINQKRQAGEECLINATGGYKAQISFVGLIGQIFKIPVYY